MAAVVVSFVTGYSAPNECWGEEKGEERDTMWYEMAR